MALIALDIINYVCNIRFTSEASLGQMLCAHECEIVRMIVEAGVSIVNTGSPDFSERILISTASYIKLLTKQAPPSNAVILTILYVLKTLIFSSQAAMKYKSLHDFLGTYPEFSARDIGEQDLLCQNANWMHLLFLIIPAKVGVS